MKNTLIVFLVILTASSSIFSQALHGTHTIGPNGFGEYESFNSAIDSMYKYGVSDTLTFIVDAENYNEQVIIDGSLINYTNGIKPIKFISQLNNPNLVTLKYASDTLNNFTLKIKDISKLTIEGFTIEALDTSFGQVIVFENYVDSTIVANNIIIGVDSVNIKNQTTCVNIKELNKDSTMIIEFNKNKIYNGKNGISNIDYSNHHHLSLTINQNKFENQKHKIISVNNSINNIYNNYIHSNYAECGISAYTADSSIISGNNIILGNNSQEAINISGNTLISNNFIIVNHGSRGIFANNCDAKILNNTIFLKNSSYSFCIDISGTALIKNNCLINYDNEIIIHNSTDDYSLLTMDYNNLYSNSSYFNYKNTINKIGGNSHSVSFMPDFVSETDLHTNSALLFETGIALPEITTDIDGEIRNDPPCIGADEFTTPVFNIGNDTVLCYYKDNYKPYNTYIYNIGEGFDSYQWSNGSDSSSITIDSTTSIIGNNTYSVTVTSGSNTYTDTINILYDLPTAITQTDYCVIVGESVTIWAEPNLTYLWNNADTTQFYNLDAFSYPNLLVTDNYGCSNKVNIKPHANYYPAKLLIDPNGQNTVGYVYEAPSDTIICNDDFFTLRANSQYSENYSYRWNTGDTTQMILVDLKHFGVGLHTFIVTITNKETILNCESSDTIIVEIQNCTGINEINNNINIYPNPANSFIIIKNENMKLVHVFDFMGKEILKTYENKISVNNLPNGIYFIKVELNDNNIINRKVLIKHLK